MDFLDRIIHEFQLAKPLLPTYLHLFVSALFPIYTASHASLTRPSSAGPSKKRSPPDSDDDEGDDDEPSPAVESLTPSDAILFPLLAGATLTGLYFILKALKDAAWFNYYLGLYFAVVGIFFAVRFFRDGLKLVRSWVFPLQYSRGGVLWLASAKDEKFTAKDGSSSRTVESPLPGVLNLVPLPARAHRALWTIRRQLYANARLELSVRNMLHLKMPVDVLDVTSVVVSAAVVGYHTFIAKPWFLTNLLGFSFCYGSLQFMTPGTSWTGTLLLSALFFYDIYFVFYTPMMVTVATKLDVPIKLLFPRPSGCVLPVGGALEGSIAMEKYLECLAKQRTMAMLGLGDIVIPGMMLAFALRFDLYLYYSKMTRDKSSDLVKDSPSTKPPYKSATGSWGERYWTTKSHLSLELQAKRFPRPYFYTTVVGYFAGLLATVAVMQVYQHAQPALLYLVPGVLISFWGTALFRGELKVLWNFSEVPEEHMRDKKSTSKDSRPANDTKDEQDGQQQLDQSKTSDKPVVSTNEPTTKNDPPPKSESGTAATKKSSPPPNAIVYFAITLVDPDTARSATPPSTDRNPAVTDVKTNDD